MPARRFAPSKAALALSLAASLSLTSLVRGQDVSAPVTLQWFESSWKTMERRTADIFAAGYGALWTPPPGRALYTDAGGGIGYDVYDRFDLGKARDTTLYGTETGYRRVVKEFQKTAGNVYVDFVHHHEGSFDVSPGNSPGPYIQSVSDYPGFKISTPGTQDGDTYKDPPFASSGSAQYEYQYRLARLITLNFTSTNTQSFVRNPVPGFGNNVPQAPSAWAIPTATLDANGKPVASTSLRQANTPTDDNRRFYPDLQGPSRTVIDNGVSYTVYNFNTVTPSAGDPTSENVSGYMMRYAQWLIQSIGLDGLRIDAARHVPLGATNDPYNPTNVNVPQLIDRAVAGANTRKNLDGSSRSVYQFQEVFNGDPNFLQSFVRKTAGGGDTTNPNRDVLDFPLWFAMQTNLSSNQSQNNWYNIRNASQDARDDGLANNGSQSIGFVINHDEGGVDLSNVAHAFVLLRPGQAYVYFEGNDFDRTGNSSFFLKSGRGDALGGQYGNIITTLVNIRNSYGRGNYAERYIDGGGVSGFSNVYAFERVGAMIVGLSSYTAGQNVTSFDERTMYCAFTPGQHLTELTGNADDAQVDPLNQIPNYITVQNTDNSNLGTGKVTLRIPRNQNVNGVTHGKGYIVYGLPRPTGSVSLTNISQTLAPDSPTPATNSTARLSSINVISADTFSITLSTNVITFSDNYTDHRAAGNEAYLRLDDGLDLNGNGPDFPSTATSNSNRYGFERFSSNTPGYLSTTSSQAGSYSISLSAANLSEGYHYLTVRAFRARGGGESEIYTDWRQTIYIDRLPPVSAFDSFNATGSGNAGNRYLQIRSSDLTADKVYAFLDLPPNVTDADIVNMANAGQGLCTQIDRDLFSLTTSNVISGNHTLAYLTREITGSYSVQRQTGISLTNALGLGLGDLNGDGLLKAADASLLVQTLTTGYMSFNPAADFNSDGYIDYGDFLGLVALYNSRVSDPNALSSIKNNLSISYTVPEPANLSLLAPLALLLKRSRTTRG
jgi:hypothetical protein